MRGSRALILMLHIGLLVREVPAEGIALLVPAYFEPGSGRWQGVAAAAARVPLVAIANVFNGPGTGPALPEYTAAMAAVRASGGQVIGYVHTQYGRRALDVVKADMARWNQLYRLDGIFVDEMANDATESSLSYYAELARYARELDPDFKVTGNPGTNTDEQYLKRTAADTLVIFENDTGYPSFAPAAWTGHYPEYQFGHLTYAVPSPQQMTNFVNLAVGRRAGFIYVTDDSGANPWDTLPSYWEEEVNLLESLNRAAAERVRAKLVMGPAPGVTMMVDASGAVGRYVLEAASPLGQWQALSTNLTNTGTSVWRILNVPPNRFFRLRQD
jgi:hypothetical protein